MRQIVHYTEPRRKKLRGQEKYSCDDSVVKFICRGLRPFSIVDDVEFRSMMQNFIKIGSQHGNIAVDDVLHTRNFYKEKISQKYDDFVSSFPNNLTDLNGVSCTSDMWKETMTGASYICLTIHYPDKEAGQISSRILACEQLEDHSSDAIKSWFDRKRKQFKLEDKKLIMVTDNGANIKKAMNSSYYFSYACHNINLVVRYLIDNMKITHSNDSDRFNTQLTLHDDEILMVSRQQHIHISLKELIERCKLLVAYFKKSRMQSRLCTTLKQSVVTRWNSEYIMMNSIITNYDEIKPLLIEADKTEEYLFSAKEFEILVTLSDILKKFNDVTEHMSSQKKVTLPYVLIWHDHLKEFFAVDDKDLSISAKIKREISSAVDIKWKSKLSSWHYIASFLDPRYKKLSFLKDASKTNETVDEVIDLVTELLIERSVDAVDVVSQTSEDDPEDSIFSARMEHEIPSSSRDRARNLVNLYRLRFRSEVC